MKKLLVLTTAILLLISLFSCGGNDDINGPVTPNQNKGKLKVTFKTDKPIENSVADITIICPMSDWENPNGDNSGIIDFSFTSNFASYTTVNDANIFGASYYYYTENDNVEEPYNLYVEVFIGDKKVLDESYIVEPNEEFNIIHINYPADE